MWNFVESKESVEAACLGSHTQTRPSRSTSSSWSPCQRSSWSPKWTVFRLELSHKVTHWLSLSLHSVVEVELLYNNWWSWLLMLLHKFVYFLLNGLAGEVRFWMSGYVVGPQTAWSIACRCSAWGWLESMLFAVKYGSKCSLYDGQSLMDTINSPMEPWVAVS